MSSIVDTPLLFFSIFPQFSLFSNVFINIHEYYNKIILYIISSGKSLYLSMCFVPSLVIPGNKLLKHKTCSRYTTYRFLPFSLISHVFTNNHKK